MEEIKKALREAFHAGNSYASMPEDDWKTCEKDFEAWYGENLEVFKNLTLAAVSKCEGIEREPAVCRNCGEKLDKVQARWGYCDADCLEEHRQTDC